MSHPAAVTLHTTRNGIVFMALAVFAFTAMDAVAKGLIAHYPTVEVIWARFVGHLALVLLYLGRRIAPALKTRLPWWHLARSLTQLGATAFFFASLNFIGLAEATALADISPILITLGAALFLREQLTPQRLIGVCGALTGALIVIRPGMGVFSPAALLPLACAICYAGNMLLTRLVGSRESPWAAMIYAAFFGSILCSLVVPFYWVPIAAIDLPAFALLGALGAIAQLFIIRAYSLTEAAVLAPFGYLDIVFASLWSIMVFAEFPDRYTMFGALVIAAAGLYVWRQEKTAPSPAV